MKKIDKLTKFLSSFTPSVYWVTSYEGYNGGDSRDIDVNDTDWNQTLITKINEVAARMYKDGGLYSETILISGKYSDMQGLIHSLLYMKSGITQHKGYYCIGKLAGKFRVLVIPQLEEEYKIFVCKQYDTSKDPFDVLNYQKIGVVQIKKQNT